MTVTNEDVPVARRFMPEFWRFCKRFWAPDISSQEESERFWAEAMAAAAELGKQFPDPFCQGLINRHMDYLDEMATGKDWKRGEGDE